MHLLGLCGRRRPPGADRPDRLIRENDLREVGAERFNDGAKLPHDDGFSLPRIALGERFADTSDWRDPRAKRRLRLLCYLDVALAMNMPPFRMADDRVTTAELDQHAGRNVRSEERRVGKECRSRWARRNTKERGDSTRK